MSKRPLKLQESFPAFLERARKLQITINEDWNLIKEESAVVDLPLKLQTAIDLADKIYREHRTVLDSESSLRKKYLHDCHEFREKYKTVHRAVKYYCPEDPRTHRLCRQFPQNGSIPTINEGAMSLMIVLSESPTPIPEGVIPFCYGNDVYDQYICLVDAKAKVDDQLTGQTELTEKRDDQFRELRAVMKLANDAARFRFRNDSERRKRYGGK